MSSLIINHNTQALNTHRNLVNVDKRMKTSLEHLSSGEKIVRAAELAPATKRLDPPCLPHSIFSGMHSIVLSLTGLAEWCPDRCAVRRDIRVLMRSAFWPEPPCRLLGQPN